MATKEKKKEAETKKGGEEEEEDDDDGEEKDENIDSTSIVAGFQMKDEHCTDDDYI